jgi:hypothetical protein
LIDSSSVRATTGILRLVHNLEFPALDQSIAQVHGMVERVSHDPRKAVATKSKQPSFFIVVSPDRAGGVDGATFDVVGYTTELVKSTDPKNGLSRVTYFWCSVQL